MRPDWVAEQSRRAECSVSPSRADYRARTFNYKWVPIGVVSCERRVHLLAYGEGLSSECNLNESLVGSSFNLGGRWVYEENGGPATDTCWMANDPPAFRVTGITTGHWPVDAYNVYGPDLIGQAPGVVTYYSTPIAELVT